MSNFSSSINQQKFDQYTGGIKIYLESQADVTIISNKWFPHIEKEKYSFESAEGDEKGGGGCQAVIQKVQQARQDNIEAYGIVDRDTLLADPQQQQLFWQTDDQAFVNSKPYGEFIHVLRRWEIENYLLDPRALAKLIYNKNIENRQPIDVQDIAQDLINNEDDFIAVTLLSTMTVPNGKSSREDGFGQHKAGDDLRRECIEKSLNCTDEEFDAGCAQIKQFAQDDNDPISRWDKLSRLLDGKRVFAHIGSALTQLKKSNAMDERGQLADIIKNNGWVDDEFKVFFQRIAMTS